MRSRTTVFTAVLLSISIALITAAVAGTTGNIKGRITSAETGDPVVAATVYVMGTVRGATTDPDGRYQIVRVDPGTYTLRISHVEFCTVEVTDVEVKLDSTVEINQALTRKPAGENETIRVEGRRDILDKFVTPCVPTMSQETIRQIPVQTVDALLDKVTGVQSTAQAEVFIRGGRAGEVIYIKDGVPIGNPLAGVNEVDEGTVWPSGTAPPAHGGTAIVNDEPFDAMFFKHYGVNPFEDTEDDHYSTFAIDVDDASYTMTRSYLERGHLPPQEAVRPEEFINYFQYDYTPPTHDAFAVHLESAPSKFGTRSVWLLRIAIKGREIKAADRKPANLVFVIDISGSMNRENRLGLVKRALRLLVNELTPNDQVGIVVYGSHGRVILDPTSIYYRHRILNAIESLHPGGSTYAAEGIRLGYEMADRMFDPQKINRVILCTDGVANVGITGAEGILEQIRSYAERGITLSAIGFGMGNYNDILLEKLGDKGNGHYAYVDDLHQARRVFVENLTGTLQVIARDVKLQVDFNPDVVRSYRLIGYENRDVPDEKFRDDKEDGGEIGSGHRCTALYELKLHRDATDSFLGTLFIRHRDPVDLDKVTEVNFPLTTDAFTSRFEDTSPDFRLAAAAAQFAELLRGSYWAKKDSFGDLADLCDEISREIKSKEVSELKSLVRKASELTLAREDRP